MEFIWAPKRETDYVCMHVCIWTQQNPGGTESRGEEKEGGGGGRGIFEIFIGRKIAGDETSNRKQNFRMNFKMFSWVI